MKDKVINLPNRYGYKVELVYEEESRWSLVSPSPIRYGLDPDTNSISFFDPPGGPFVMVEEILSGHVVIAIDCQDENTYVWMLPENIDNFEQRKKNIRTVVSSKTKENNSRIVIGMIGKAGSGKDTVGDYLKEKYGFTGLALADTLKRGIQEMFVIPDDVMYDRKKREEPLPDMPDWSVRKLLQYMGTELVRNHIDPNAWTKSLIKRYPKTGNVVVTDVRFPNEVEGIQTMSDCPVFFIRVKRPGYVGTDVGIKNHASEIHDIEGDYTIVNSGTIEDLYAETEEVLKKIKTINE